MEQELWKLAALAWVSCCRRETWEPRPRKAIGVGNLELHTYLGGMPEPSRTPQRQVCVLTKETHTRGWLICPPLLPPGTGNVNLLTCFVVKRIHVTENPVRQQSRPWKVGSRAQVAYCTVAEEFFCLAFVSSESSVRFLRDSVRILHEDGGAGQQQEGCGLDSGRTLRMCVCVCVCAMYVLDHRCTCPCVYGN